MSSYKHPLTIADARSAAKVAMSMLRNGASAADAVEIAIMLLEDSEITNAGYGSNLTIDGSVECDATLIDHKGRSGAVGAVARKLSAFALRVSTQVSVHWPRRIADSSRCQKPNLARARHLGSLSVAIVSTESASKFPCGTRWNRLCIRARTGNSSARRLDL